MNKVARILLLGGTRLGFVIGVFAVASIALRAAALAGTCTSPIVVPAYGGTFTGATSGASIQQGTCAYTSDAPEQVFQWTPAVSGVANISTCSATLTTFDTVLYLRSGSCAAGTEVACNDDTVGCGITTDPSSPHHGSVITPTVVAGQSYFIIVDGYGASSGSFLLTISPPASPPPATATATTPPRPSATPTAVFTATPQSAASGQCSSPLVIPASGGVFTGISSGTSQQQGTCAYTSDAPEQVFQWTPSTSGTATIQTCSSTQTTFDTVLYVRTGSCTGGTELACNDDTVGCGTTYDGSSPHRGSVITPAVTAGQTYYIIVDGYGTAAGNFLLTVSPPAGGGGGVPTPTAAPTPGTTFSAQAAWSPVTGAAGYKLYVRQGTAGYAAGTDVGALAPGSDGVVRYVTGGLPMGVMNYFSVTSYNSAGVESALSNELSLIVQPTPTAAVPPSATATRAAPPSATATAVRTTPGATATPQPSFTARATVTASATVTRTVTTAPTRTATAAPTRTATARATATATATATPSANPTGTINLALRQPAQQSSTLWAAGADRAVDGNTDGRLADGSVAQTYYSWRPWWTVDLGATYGIGTVQIWNRTDCCQSQLSKFYVLVSSTPFTSSDLATTVTQPGVMSYYVAGTAGRPTNVAVNTNGRYVRIQLIGTNYLSLAEVRVLSR